MLTDFKLESVGIMAVQKKYEELKVITKAKELSMYILGVTENSPKKFRFTFITRLQNYSLDVIENLYYANSIYLVPGITKAELHTRKASSLSPAVLRKNFRNYGL